MNQMMKEQLQFKTAQIEEIIKSYLPKEEGHQKTVIAAMNYTMCAGGKRLRPMLMDETYRMYGGTDRSRIEPFIAAIEMIHTYSLIHDDLPAMDDDDYRRGRKTAHVVYGEAMAILAGDALLNYAFETACKAFRGTEEDILVGQALKVLSEKPGIYGMIGGQTADVENEGKEISLDTLLFIHEKKTSALIECAMMIGAILAGASGEEISRIEQIARKVGLAFQIQDDILDRTGSSELLGKPVGSDEKNEKNTYLSFASLDQAQRDQKTMIKEAIQAYDSLSGKNDFLRELLLALAGRKY